MQCHVIICQWSDCWLWQVKSAADLFGALVIVIEGLLEWIKLSTDTLQFNIQINTRVCFQYTSLSSFQNVLTTNRCC